MATIRLNKTRIITAIRECGRDEEKLFQLVQAAYSSGYTKGHDEAIDHIFTHVPEEA